MAIELNILKRECSNIFFKLGLPINNDKHLLDVDERISDEYMPRKILNMITTHSEDWNTTFNMSSNESIKHCIFTSTHNKYKIKLILDNNVYGKEFIKVYVNDFNNSRKFNMDANLELINAMKRHLCK